MCPSCKEEEYTICRECCEFGPLPCEIWDSAEVIEEMDAESYGFCALCNHMGMFQVEDLPVGPRWFCTEKHFAQYAGLPVKESGYYGFEAEYDQSIDISMTCPKCEKTLLPVGEGGDRKSENMMHFDYYCDCDEKPKPKPKKTNKPSKYVRFLDDKHGVKVSYGNIAKLLTESDVKPAFIKAVNHMDREDLRPFGYDSAKPSSSAFFTSAVLGYFNIEGYLPFNQTQMLCSKCGNLTHNGLRSQDGVFCNSCLPYFDSLTKRTYDTRGYPSGYNAESFESELERKYFARFGDARGGKEWGEYNFTWFNDVDDWKPIDEDTTGWDEDDYEDFRENKEYDLVNNMLSDSKSRLYHWIELNQYGDEELFNTPYKVLNEDGEEEDLSLFISWEEPEIEQQKIQYYDKEPLLNLEFLAETKKLPPVEKAIDTGIASGATMEGLETLLAAESFNATSKGFDGGFRCGDCDKTYLYHNDAKHGGCEKARRWYDEDVGQNCKCMEGAENLAERCCMEAESYSAEEPSVYWWVKGALMEKMKEDRDVTIDDVENIIVMVAANAPLNSIDKGMKEAEQFGDKSIWEILKLAAMGRADILSDDMILSEKLRDFQTESFASYQEHTCEHCDSTDIDYGNNWKCHDCGRYAAEEPKAKVCEECGDPATHTCEHPYDDDPDGWCNADYCDEHWDGQGMGGSHYWDCNHCDGDGEIPSRWVEDGGDRWNPPTLEVRAWEECEYCNEGKICPEADVPIFEFEAESNDDLQLDESKKRTKMSMIRTGLAITTFGIVMWNLWTNKKQEKDISDIMADI